MEKPRDRTKQVFRCGLLIALSLFTLFSASATNVDFFVSSFEFLQGEPLRVELVVQDTEPSNASLNILNVPDSFVLIQSRKERRSRDTLFSLEWTVLEFGDYSLGPFLLIVGDETIEMPVIHLMVGPPSVTDTTQVRWVIDEGKYRVGERKPIALEAFFTGSVIAIHCPVPENALLEEVYSSPLVNTNGWTIVGKWLWTPLMDGPQSLPAALIEFSLENRAGRTIASTPLTVKVEAARVVNASPEVTGALLKAFSDLPTVEKVQEPQIDIATIKRVAELRHEEYISYFPSQIRKEREKLEKILLLKNTPKVPYAPWKAVSVIGTIVLVFLFLLFHIASQRWRGFKHFSRFIALVAFLFLACAVYIYISDISEYGVVLSDNLRHVPENTSSIIAEVLPGSSVKILKSAGDWVYVETTDPSRGWVQIASIIEYTTDARKGIVLQGELK